ncbi:four-carbon acid sugar kinase family protein [Paenibacillus sp. FSL R10-2734]|uniref:four-carbon acid sugar kinase family protein n=1 Tax=Paenibacillus sp. FSL R10-2734 TaxID=2954691 RepID=UPI0030DB9E93
MEALVLADDLTGAADTAAAFIDGRRRIALSLFDNGELLAVPTCDVWAIDAATRGMSQAEAYKATYNAVITALSGNPRFVYKKLDSALRGNISNECDAVIEAFRADLCIVCPAVPKLGRTTLHGEQLVNGIPVHETEMGRDPMNPVHTSHIATILRHSTNQGIARIGLDQLTSAAYHMCHLFEHGMRYVICDAVEDADLDLIVAAGLYSGLRIVWAGTAGLAQALARTLDIPKEVNCDSDNLLKMQPDQGAAWFISGSQTLVTERQLNEFSPRCRINCQYTAESLLRESNTFANTENDWSRDDLVSDGPLVQDAIFATAREEAEGLLFFEANQRGISIREMSSILLGSFVRRVRSKLDTCKNVSLLVLIGGETARSMLKELTINTIFLEHEFEPGIIESVAVLPRAYKIITKSGAFGDPNTLVRILEKHRIGG